MNRLLSRVGVRVASVSLLVSGVAGGVYLGQSSEAETQTVPTQVAIRADADEMQLLKERQSQHAAARAWRAAAESDAAVKAATEAKAAASKARKLEQKVIAEKKAKEEAKKAAEADAGDGSSYEFDGPIPPDCDGFSGNRKIGCAMTLDAGFAMGQFSNCLEPLWKKESGWNHKALNKSSQAYGIPQSLPGGKMGSVAGDWRTNPKTQIKWGLNYIKGRYGTPCKAWAHSKSVGWY